MTKCANCTREAVDGFRRCLSCRRSHAKAKRKCRTNNRERGVCPCGRAKLDGYSQCQWCQRNHLRYDRRRRNSHIPVHLYVALTPRGLKIGRSGKPRQRMGQLKRVMFAHMDGDVKPLDVYEGKGHLEQLVHFGRLPRARLSGSLQLRPGDRDGEPRDRGGPSRRGVRNVARRADARAPERKVRWSPSSP